MNYLAEKIGDVMVVSKNGRLELHIPGGWNNTKLKEFKLTYQPILDKLRLETKPKDGKEIIKIKKKKF